MRLGLRAKATVGFGAVFFPDFLIDLRVSSKNIFVHIDLP